MQKKISGFLLNALVNIVFLCIGFYCDPTMLILGVPWPLLCLGIIVLFNALFLLYVFGKKIAKSIWKKFVKELKRELNIV